MKKMKKINVLLASILLMVSTSCDNSKDKAEEIVKAFETKIAAVGFNVQDNSFQDILDQYNSELENYEVETIVNEKIADLFNNQLKKYVLKISIAEKLCEGNVGKYLVIQNSSPLEIKSEENVFNIPFEIKSKEVYKQLFEHDFSIQEGIVLDKQGDEFTSQLDIDIDWEKIINGESQSEKGKLRYSYRECNSYGSIKNIVNSYIEIINNLNKIRDINIKVNRGKNSSESSSESSSSNDDSNEEEPEVASTVDCDQFIADYEAFVNSYIVIIKKMKANPSDMSIMSEYTEMISTATTMQENVGDCMDDAKYAVKLAKLVTKMTNALAGM